jgi:hypothetical protein
MIRLCAIENDRNVRTRYFIAGQLFANLVRHALNVALPLLGIYRSHITNDAKHVTTPTRRLHTTTSPITSEIVRTWRATPQCRQHLLDNLVFGGVESLVQHRRQLLLPSFSFLFQLFLNIFPHMSSKPIALVCLQQTPTQILCLFKNRNIFFLKKKNNLSPKHHNNNHNFKNQYINNRFTDFL